MQLIIGDYFCVYFLNKKFKRFCNHINNHWHELL